MSTLQVQGLGIPSTDDPMETDADRRAGQVEDIDIDLDLTEEQQQDEEDEYMSEDVTAFNQQATGTIQADEPYNDDEMADDGDVEQDVVYDASVQDEDLQDAEEMIAAQADEDDEIVDVINAEPVPTSQMKDIPQYQDPTTNEKLNNRNEDNQTSKLGQEQGADPAHYQKIFNHEGTISQTQESPDLSKEQELEHSTDNKPAYEPQKHEAQDLETESALNSYADGQNQRSTPEPVASDVATQALSQSVDYTSSDSSKAVDQQPKDADNTTRDPEAPDYNDRLSKGQDVPPISPATYALDQTDQIDHYEDPSKATIYIHPVVVVYQGTELSLFRPVGGDRDFVLEDENLAGDSIANLLAACRPVLGEDVHEQELVLSVDDLDLQISEFAHDASVTAISQLIDIYLQLQHHDGIENPPDLRVKLSTNPSFSHRLGYLRDAVEEGKGLSQVRLIEDDQEEEGDVLADQGGKYEDENVNGEALVPTEPGSHEQDNKESGATVHETTSANMPMAPAVNEESILQNNTQKTDVQTRSEQASDAQNEEYKTKETPAHKTNYQLDKLDLEDTEAHRMDASAENGMQLQHRQEPALLDDEEDIIDYEDGAIGPESSSGSSTLHGDVETADRVILSSAPPVAFKEEALPKTETSSHALEASLNDLASHPLVAEEEVDDLDNAEDGNEDLKDLQDRELDEQTEAKIGDFKAAGQEDGNRFADEEDRSADVDGTSSADYQYQNNRADGDDYEGSLEAHQDKSEEYESEQVLYGSLDAIDRGDYIEDTADLDQQETHDRSSVQHPQEGNKYAEVEYDDDQGLIDVTEVPRTTTVDEDQNHKNEDSNNAEVQPSMHAIADTEDNDEITYEDEDEDEDEENKAPNIEEDEFPSPGSLKRSRIHPDADDTTAEELQDAKRIRST